MEYRSQHILILAVALRLTGCNDVSHWRGAGLQSALHWPLWSNVAAADSLTRSNKQDIRPEVSWWRHQMENIFRVTGHLCGEFTDNRWIPLTKVSDAELWCFLWSELNKRFVNNREAGDLRRHRVHYDVTVMCWVIPYNLCPFTPNNSARFLVPALVRTVYRTLTYSSLSSLVIMWLSLCQ